MPSHLSAPLALWHKTITANTRAFEAGLEYARAHNQPVAPERLHALDYMVYAYLQQGRDREARATVDTAQHLMTASIASDALIANYNQIAMEARLPLERGDWAAASRLPVRAAELTIGAALAHFTRGIGAGRLGDTARTGVEIAALAAIQADMARRGDNDWASVVDIKRQVVTAWRGLAAGGTAAAPRGGEGAAAPQDGTHEQ